MKNCIVLMIIFTWGHDVLLGSTRSFTSRYEPTEDFVPADTFIPARASSRASNSSTSSYAESISSESSQDSQDMELFAGKKRFLELIRSYLMYDVGLSSSDIAATIKRLQKKSLLQLRAEFENNSGFKQRYTFLKHYKTFLIRYQSMSESDANAQINTLKDMTLNQIHQRYYALCQSLTKDQMLEIIHDHVQFDQQFFGSDADQEIAELSRQPLMQLRDRFMQYQKTFVAQDIDTTDDRSFDRTQKLQHEYDIERSQRSIVRKVPLVKNIEELLPAKITNWSDQELFKKLAAQMRNLGFNQRDIDAEIDQLQHASVADLKNMYPHLQLQLSHQLYYFDTKKHPTADATRSADFWLQQLHAWGSTAAGLISAGMSVAGYDASTMSAIASFALFNPLVTLSTGITKRDMLDMIYAQYHAFDVIHDVYINHAYQPTDLLKKSALIGKISDCLVALNIGANARRKQEASYEKLGKQQLEDVYRELSFFVEHAQQISLSSFEKTVLMQTKPELLKRIKIDLEKLDIPAEQIDQKIAELDQENIQFVRAACLDIHQATTQKTITRGVMPEIVSNPEQLLKKAPKLVSAHLIDRAQPVLDREWNRLHKSPAYQAWKKRALHEHIERQPVGLFEHAVDTAYKANRAYSLLGLKSYIGW